MFLPLIYYIFVFVDQSVDCYRLFFVLLFFLYTRVQLRCFRLSCFQWNLFAKKQQNQQWELKMNRTDGVFCDTVVQMREEGT